MSQCIEHGKEGHVCNHGPSSFAESLDEVEFSRSIHAACISNNLERVRTILAKQNRGESPACALDSAGYTALHYSSRAGNKEICTLLLNAGADVDAATPELGATPLMRSIQQGHLDVSRLLVSYGASIDVRNSDHENIFHVLAIAASKDNTMQTSDKTEKSVAMALWLMTKLDKDRRIAMLTASDVKGRRPVDYLEAGSLAALLTPPN
ncbi:MAG: ankyrin repeat-containing domain protein [Podila humilis]|nr:MAG: ankyrin repeat-containing domain protein [Podila humilis]